MKIARCKICTLKFQTNPLNYNLDVVFSVGHRVKLQQDMQCHIGVNQPLSELTNPLTYQLNNLQNSSTYQLTNSTTYQLTILTTHKLTNCTTYQLINSPTYNLNNPPTYQLHNLSTHKLTNYKLTSLPTYKPTNSPTSQLQPNRIAFGKLLPTASKTRIAWHQDTLTQGQRNTLVCLRCIYGFPNSILFDYKTTYKLINSSTYDLKNILQNTPHSPPPSRKI